MMQIGSPPSSSSVTRVVSSYINTFNERSDALPFGREALKRLGGVEKEAVDKGVNALDLAMIERIVIPLGVTPATLKNFTLYQMLGLDGDLGDVAGTEVIKKAYHKAVLVYHPDKAQHKSADGKKEDRSVFLKVQEAFNVLSNQVKRRAYDSQMPFDETTPTEERVGKALVKGPAKFFKLYDTVFKRNARFAVKKPVPEIGNDETPMNEVYRFYEYWINFESWRDFTGVGAEHKIDDAMSRDEKRYYAKENEAKEKKMKKKEMTRLIEMVMLAEKSDPRITADKQRKKAAKEAEKDAKESSSKNRIEMDLAVKAWIQELDDKANENMPSTKADKEKLKKAQSKARNTLKKLLRISGTSGHGSGEYGIVSEADVEVLCSNCEMEDLNIMNNALGGEPALKDESLFLLGGSEEVLSRVKRMQSLADEAVEDERIAKDAKKRENLEAAQSKKKNNNLNIIIPDRDWSTSDLEVLDTAIKRYPAGNVSRWLSITHYVNDKLLSPEAFAKASSSISQDECLRAAFTAAH